MLAWLSVWSEVQTYIWPSRCHCHSLSLASVKSSLALPFWYRLARVVPDKGPLNVCVCAGIAVVGRLHAAEAVGREQRRPAAAQVHAGGVARCRPPRRGHLLRRRRGRVEPVGVRSPAARLAAVRLGVPRQPRAARPLHGRRAAARARPRRRAPAGEYDGDGDGAGAAQHRPDDGRAPPRRTQPVRRRRTGCSDRPTMVQVWLLPRDAMHPRH